MAHPSRGMFTGNRGCLVDDDENVVRHHGTNLLWITCRLHFRDWRVGLARPGRWTPLFLLDDAVALAAGHRPCSTCRRADYVAYRDAVSESLDTSKPPSATELNRRLAAERMRPGRGMERAKDRLLWRAQPQTLPAGTVVLDGQRRPCLWTGSGLQPFGFDGWGAPMPASSGELDVLTPPTSVAALRHGFEPTMHPSAHTVRD